MENELEKSIEIIETSAKEAQKALKNFTREELLVMSDEARKMTMNHELMTNKERLMITVTICAVELELAHRIGDEIGIMDIEIVSKVFGAWKKISAVGKILNMELLPYEPSRFIGAN